MAQSGTQEMLQTAARACAYLEAEARGTLAEFTLSRQNPDGGFRGRGGPNSDLYYTIFGTAVLATLVAVCLLVLAVVYLLTKNILPGLGSVAGILLAFWFYLKHCIARRATAFENQFVDALDLAARSLRAGHPLMGSFRLISEEIPPPVSTVFSEICQHQALGMSMEQALQGVADKTTSVRRKDGTPVTLEQDLKDLAKGMGIPYTEIALR